ncbi:hypothetical protein BSU04nite_01620 [Bacillus spizizenii]|nr:hypothetical protein BSU04nite_01620 [Bacillus spizizenii]
MFGEGKREFESAISNYFGDSKRNVRLASLTMIKEFIKCSWFHKC